MKILIIEDDRELSLAIAEYLELQGVDCDFAYNGASGINLASSQPYTCIILDMMLPKVNGLEVCQTLREQACTTPILMLSACDTDLDQLKGFEAGLDDYVTKPCQMPLLWARLQAIVRRGLPDLHEFKVANLIVNLSKYSAIREGIQLKFTPTSWKILEILIKNSPNVVSKSDILEYVWPDSDTDEGTLNVHLHQLRKTIDKPFSRALIQTHVGLGLSLQEKMSSKN